MSGTDEMLTIYNEFSTNAIMYNNDRDDSYASLTFTYGSTSTSNITGSLAVVVGFFAEQKSTRIKFKYSFDLVGGSSSKVVCRR